MLCRTQFIRRKRLWCLVSAGAAIWVSDVFLVRIMFLRCLQRFSGASESSQHPSWDAEGGQYRICLHLGGPRTENQTSLTSTTALLTMPVRGWSVLPALRAKQQFYQNQRRGFLHITLHLCFWVCPFLILAFVFIFYFLRGHCCMNKEEGSDKEPFSVPPSIPLLLLFISYLF